MSAAIQARKMTASQASRQRKGNVTAQHACGLVGVPVAKGMKKISYAGYRFPPEIIQQSI
jgi:hypothetical protein